MIERGCRLVALHASREVKEQIKRDRVDVRGLGNEWIQRKKAGSFWYKKVSGRVKRRRWVLQMP